MNICVFCNIITNTTSKYCSKECCYKARDLKRGKLPKENRKCLICETIILSTDRRDKVYCTQSCKSRDLIKKYHKKTKETIQTFLFNVDNYKHLISGDLEETYIECSGSKDKGKQIIIDSKYLILLKEISDKWYLDKNNYPRNCKGFRLHRIIAQLKYGEIPKDKVVDHINRNTLDNRESNLRLATTTQNSCNADRKLNACSFKGVYKNYDKYTAQISVDGKVKHLGRFCTPEEAAIAYNQAALEYQGEFAVLNIIE